METIEYCYPEQPEEIELLYRIVQGVCKKYKTNVTIHYDNLLSEIDPCNQEQFKKRLELESILEINFDQSDIKLDQNIKELLPEKIYNFLVMQAVQENKTVYQKNKGFITETIETEEIHKKLINSSLLQVIKKLVEAVEHNKNADKFTIQVNQDESKLIII